MIALDSGWCLAPEGAAIHPREKVAVIADVHLGYEWSRGAGGDLVPAHSLRETLVKVQSLLTRAPVSRLIVAGDLVESPEPCPRTARDVNALADWLRLRGVELICLRGNHDPPRPRRSSWPWTIEVAGWTIGHGHRAVPGARVVMGHHHPVLRTAGLSAPCFLAGEDLIALPAFSPNAAGLNVGAAALPPVFRDKRLRCLAGAGGELIDFGPVEILRQRFREVGL
jgi:putative SbcD/Mre11-related phosphoesterase